MDIIYAEKLIEELEGHPPLTKGTKLNWDYFTNLLVSTPIPDSKRFYAEVKSTEQQLIDSAKSQLHLLSLRRVLRNKLAEGYKLSKIKELYEAVASILGIYDSDVLTRKLRANSNLVRMMGDSYIPYSLLGKLETHDLDSSKVAKRPILVIPGAKDLQKILDWEEENTMYEVAGLFGRIKGISRAQYIKG